MAHRTGAGRAATPVVCRSFAGLSWSTTLALSELREIRAIPEYVLDSVPELLVPAADAVPSHHWNDAGGAITLSALRHGRVTYLRVPGLLEARIDGTHADLCVLPGANAPVARHAVLNQILPRVLDGTGELMLHAAMIVIAGKRAILLLGDTCYGKSTLGAAFVKAGSQLLTDDGLRLDPRKGAVRAIPTYPSLRLREDSSAVMCSSGPVPLASRAHEAVGLPVAAIMVLKAPSATIGITVDRMSPADAAMAVVRNSFALDPTDLERARGRLDQIARAVAAVPTYRVDYPRDYARLPEVVACLRGLV